MIDDQYVPIRCELVSNVVKLRFIVDGTFPSEIRGAVQWRKRSREEEEDVDQPGPSTSNAPPEDPGHQS